MDVGTTSPDRATCRDARAVTDGEGCAGWRLRRSHAVIPAQQGIMHDCLSCGIAEGLALSAEPRRTDRRWCSGSVSGNACVMHRLAACCNRCMTVACARFMPCCPLHVACCTVFVAAGASGVLTVPARHADHRAERHSRRRCAPQRHASHHRRRFHPGPRRTAPFGPPPGPSALSVDQTSPDQTDLGDPCVVEPRGPASREYSA